MFFNLNKKKKVAGVGFSRWKRKYVKKIFPEYKWVFMNDDTEAIEAIVTNMQVVIWGYNESTLINGKIDELSRKVWRMEDGFIRSCGLGCEKSKPYSLILDKSGHLYFDPRCASELENIVSKTKVSKSTQRQAQEIRKAIIKEDISKYNLNYEKITTESQPQKSILVIGQVEDDKSIKYGGCNYSNASLLEFAKNHSKAENVFYKIHPDELSNKRCKTKNLDYIYNNATVIDKNISLNNLLEHVDVVYTISSLLGFEALLRGKIVVTVGQPFYSSWGLTQDINPLTRRNIFEDFSREQILNHLLYCSYVTYPSFVGLKAIPDSPMRNIIAMIKEFKSKSDVVI